MNNDHRRLLIKKWLQMFVLCNNSLFYIIANHVANDNLFSSTSHLVSLLFSSSLPSISASLSFKKTQSVQQNTITHTHLQKNKHKWTTLTRDFRGLSPEVIRFQGHAIYFPLFFFFLIISRKTKDKEISRWHWKVIDGVSETGDFRLVVFRWFVKPSSVGDVRNKNKKATKALYDGLVSVKSCISLLLLNIPTYSHSNTN